MKLNFGIPEFDIGIGNPSQINDFSLFVKYSAKTLKKLQIHSFKANCQELCLFLDSIKQLPDLKTFNVNISMLEVIEECDYTITIKSVRKMKVWMRNFLSLNFVDKFFDGVKALEVMYDDHGFESTVNQGTKVHD